MTRFPRLPVPGWHNRMNAACAATAALAAGCSRDAIDRGLQSFRGLPQRMEPIAADRGPHVLQRFHVHHARIDDRRAGIGRQAGVASGGRARQRIRLHRDDRDDRPFGRGSGVFRRGRSQVARPAPGLARRLPLDRSSNAGRGLDWCWRNSQPGDAIVLSPGCSSHDQFRNFRERRRFSDLVNRLLTQSMASHQ